MISICRRVASSAGLNGSMVSIVKFSQDLPTRLDEIKNLHLEVQAGGVVRGLTPTRRARACHERRGQACWRRMLRPEGPLLPTAGAFGLCRLAAPFSWIGRQDVSRAPPELGEL